MASYDVASHHLGGPGRGTKLKALSLVHDEIRERQWAQPLEIRSMARVPVAGPAYGS